MSFVKLASRKKRSREKQPKIREKGIFMGESAPKTRVRKSVEKNITTIDTIDVSSCDIIHIDDQIKKNIKSKTGKLKEILEDLRNLNWIIENSPDVIDKIAAKTESSILRKKIRDIELGADLSFYMLRTHELIDAYRSLMAETKSSSFVITHKTDGAKIYKKNEVVKDYLRVAKEYVNLENFNQKASKLVCSACHSTDLVVDEEDDSLYICRVCSVITEILDDAPTFKDSERVNMASRYTYTCRGHFKEAMNRFEGKQNTEINQAVIDILKKELSLHGLTFESTTKDHIYMFLSEKKLSDYYADINLIYFLITGSNPPDITDYRNELLEMHDQLEEAYKEVKDDERLNSLNVNWKLYKLLQLLDYPCKKDDFFCLKTPTKQGEHEQKWYDMIEYLKKRYPSAVTTYGKKRWRHTNTI